MQAGFRKGNDLDEIFSWFARFFFARKKPDTLLQGRGATLKKRFLALIISHSYPWNKVKFCATILYSLYPCLLRFRCPVRYYITLRYESRSWWPCDLWSATVSTKAMPSFIPRREMLRRSLSARFFRSAFRFKPHDYGNNGWIHKSRCKSFLHISGRSDRRIARSSSGDIRGDKASMRKKEKETVNICAHVCKKDKRGQREEETTRRATGTRSRMDERWWTGDDKDYM